MSVLDQDTIKDHYEIVSPGEIYIDRFQRPVNVAWVKKRKGKFDKALAGVITLSDRPRGGRRYSAVDGQHRVELALQDGLEELAAVVFEDLTIEQEAELFSRLQRERRAITAGQRFNADLVAGNPQAKAINKMLKAEGLTVSPNRDDPGYIKCVRALERVYETDPGMMKTIVHLLQETWLDFPGGRSEKLVTGLARFLTKTQAFDQDRFIDRLSDTPPSSIFTRAAQKRDGAGKRGALSIYVAETIEDEYRTRYRRR